MERRQWTKMWNRYRIRKSDYEAILERQGGVCAICGGAGRDGYRLDVDHDHSCCPGESSCGKCIRGLLCGSCNRALGMFGDDPNRMLNAIEYLSRSTTTKEG